MNINRIKDLHNILLSHHYPVSKDKIITKMECSKSTFYDTVNYMKTEFNSPIEFEKDKGYYYTDKTYELPGFWLNTSQLIALANLMNVIKQIESNHLPNLIKDFEQLVLSKLKEENVSFDLIGEMIQIIPAQNRVYNIETLESIISAIQLDKKCSIVYFSRHSNQKTNRLISPVRIVRYKDNWYLDAYCHQQEAARTFSIDSIDQINLDTSARENCHLASSKHFQSGFGMFAGDNIQHATLECDEYISPWISKEIWHPKQQSQWQDGKYILTIPYTNSTELKSQILKYLPHIKVTKPKQLAQEIIDLISQGLQLYKES